MGFQQSGGKGPYLFSTVKSRGKLEGVADAQMLSSESVIKPFSKGGFPTRRLPQNHCEPLKRRYPCLQTPKRPLVGRALAGLFQQHPQDPDVPLFLPVNALMWDGR